MTATASKKMLSKARDIEKRLAALDGPEWASDSSDDEAAAPAAKPEKPAAPKAGKKQQQNRKEQSRVVYVGHVPHGFYEQEMEGFFSQFGELTNLRLSRSKRTGASKGYAFLEFGDAATAKIAAQTMDKYLMHGKQLVAHVVPVETANRPKLFKGSDKPFLKRVGAKEQRERGDGPNPASLKKKERKKREKLAEQFPGYDYPGFTEGEAPPPAAPSSKKKRKSDGGSAPPPPAPPPSKKKAKDRALFQSPPVPATRKRAAAGAPKSKQKSPAKKPEQTPFNSPPMPRKAKKAAKTPPVAAPKTTPRSSLKDKLLSKKKRKSSGK